MRFSLRAAVLVIVFLVGFNAWGQNAANPVQLALLRWYSANIVTQFSPCPGPQGLAFDGAHMWVACGSAGSLVEYDASDGTVVRTVTGLGNAYALLYDGANIWVSNASSVGQVTKVDAATGSVLATVTVGPNPHGMAFDGANIWVGYGQGSHLPAAGAYKL